MQGGRRVANIEQGVNDLMDRDLGLPPTTVDVLKLDRQRDINRRREKTVNHMQSDSSVCKKVDFSDCMDTDD